MEACYLDTSFLTTAIYSSLKHHRAAAAFAQRLFADNTTVYISELVRLEFAQSLKKLCSQVDQATRDHFRLQHWDRQDVRERWIEVGVSLLDSFLSQFNYVELSITPAIVEDACSLMGKVNLSSYDATHVALALAAGVSNLAANDDHFERASGLLTFHHTYDPADA